MAGQHNIHLPDIHEEMRLIKKAIIHPNYTWNDKEFDIGLLQVASPFTFSDYIQVGMGSSFFWNWKVDLYLLLFEQELLINSIF